MAAKKVRVRKRMALDSPWLWYALSAMALFSVSNVLLKVLVGRLSLSSIPLHSLAIAAGAVGVAIAIAYVVFLRSHIPSESLPLLAFFLVIASTAFILLLKAYETGSAALITAIVSLSTIGVALLSFFFLGDRFTFKEWAAVGLATASVLLLVS